MVQNKDNLELEIILVLLNNKSYLREIARILNKSHSTVLRKINLMVKEGVLDYKKEGKNKIFFIKDNLKAKNYIYSAEMYKLNKLLEKYPKLSVIVEDIKKNVKKGMIVLFGSYAKGTARKDSDIDIYIETNDKKTKEKIESLHSKLNVKIGDFNTNSLLIKEIIKNHVIIRGVEEFYERANFFEKS